MTTQKEINALSTFNGMGCLWYAFDRIGVKVNKRYVSEIDKYANKSNDAAYPDSIHLGDVRRVDVSKLDENGVRKDYNPSIKAKQQLEPNLNGKSNCLTTVQKDNLILIDFSHKNEGIRLYKDKAPTMNARDYKEPRCITDGYILRRLTPRECGRLQTFIDKELDVLLSAGISDTQLYKQFGNGWTIDAIAHMLSFMEL